MLQFHLLNLIAIKKKFCLRSHPQIGIHFLVAIASTHPQHWQWGRRGSVCGWPLWGPCKERWPYWVLKRCACSASTFTMAARSASTFKMAVRGSQELRLPRFNLLDGRTGFSSAAPVTQTNGICKIIVQTKSPTKPTALWREHNFGVASQTV